MKAAEKYRHVFGSIHHLKDQISWTTGLTNMVEFLAWEPKQILGITKKQYVRQIIEWATDPELAGKDVEEIEHAIIKKLNTKMHESEQLETYSTQRVGICHPREATRRVMFFSEEYLNKEFDIFLSLCSDTYLDLFYQQFITFKSNETWSMHGNSGLFEASTALKAMYMDNLAYNHQSNVLIANELKFNGRKNPDQILKYCVMYEHLLENGFIDKGTKFLLLFVGGDALEYNKQRLVDRELALCHKRPKKYQHLLRQELLDIVDHLQVASLTWPALIAFNDCYLAENNVCQVEQKLLQGFRQSLQSKSFMHLAV
ncbi:hypothetical protein NJD71_06185 [Psychrobacter sp. PP-21]|uniref:hypothetical protein n=1 Tax=Psychrobacter sp. PP-21 TaxID=2957503 RepID=UPI0029A5BAE4|nr:hypothetical protein [Psychrobacter sp. PP-21]MDX2373716.1 hypothetical protein [Psychrobacter sp. PP-21]